MGKECVHGGKPEKKLMKEKGELFVTSLSRKNQGRRKSHEGKI